MSTKAKFSPARRHPWADEWLRTIPRAKKTVKEHERVLNRLFAYIESQGGPNAGNVDFCALVSIYAGEILVGKGPIDTELLSNFLVWHVEGVEDSDSRAEKWNRAVYTLRLFFRWCVDRHYLPTDPTRYLEVAFVRRRVNHRKYLTSAESHALLEAAATSGQHAPRDHAVVATLLLAGLRPGELCNLTPQDLDFENGWIRVDGKTGEGSAPMPPALAGILRVYLASPYYQELAQGRPDHPLFPNNTGQQPLSTRNLCALIRQLCLSAGIDREVTPYWLRHTFATRLYRQGMHFVKVSLALRHAKLKNTYVYVHGREDRMRALVQSSPTSALLSDVYRSRMGLAVPQER